MRVLNLEIAKSNEKIFNGIKLPADEDNLKFAFLSDYSANGNFLLNLVIKI
jgi:hypothetical protein